VSVNFKSACKGSLERNLPSNLLYSFGAALYEKSNRMKTSAQKDFFRKATERVLSSVKSLRTLEAQYYV
jgi:hypothetical protein